MKKYVVLLDCYGNELKLTEEEAKNHVLVHGNNTIWAIHPSQEYKDGDWVELCFLPTYNAEWNEEEQDYVFCHEIWDEKRDNDPLTISKHFYHNLALKHEKPTWGFTSPWKGDMVKDPYCMYSYIKSWIIEEDSKEAE